MSTKCQCPNRLHCASRRRHPACRTCDRCASATPATCLKVERFCFRHGEEAPCFECGVTAANAAQDSGWREWMD